MDGLPGMGAMGMGMGGVLIGLLVAVALFFLFAWFFQLLWNAAVARAFTSAVVRKIDYWTAAGLLLFLGLFLGCGTAAGVACRR